MSVTLPRELLESVTDDVLHVAAIRTKTEFVKAAVREKVGKTLELADLKTRLHEQSAGRRGRSR